MQKEQSQACQPEIRELTKAEIEAVSGGWTWSSIFSRLVDGGGYESIADQAARQTSTTTVGIRG